MKVVLASHNTGKLREFQGAYADLGIEWISAVELNLPDIDEPYTTFIENALHKARTVSSLTGLPALADDSGLCVPALGGRPGVYSARFAGEPCNDVRNNQLLLDEMKGIEDRRAYYYAVLVLCESKDDPQPCIAEGCWWGRLLEQPVGKGGFGYDPLFLDEVSNLSAAQLSLEDKQSKSHRGQALKRLEPILRQRFA
jgi:XTP/dITP diphosphohydrolase